MRLFLTSVLSEEPWKYDSKVVPLPWRRQDEEAVKTKLQSGGLTLGVFNCDGNVRLSVADTSTLRLSNGDQVLPHPPILRGIETVVSALKKNGHSVVPWTPYKHDFAVDMINGIYGADGSTVSHGPSPTESSPAD